jgi:hypothetical protein
MAAAALASALPVGQVLLSTSWLAATPPGPRR